MESRKEDSQKERVVNNKTDSQKISEEDSFADDDSPPVLEPESSAGNPEFEQSLSLVGGISVTQHGYAADDPQFGLEDEYYVDNGILYQKQLSQQLLPTKQEFVPVHNGHPEAAPTGNTNVCCGLCGEVVPYELLVSEHLTNFHPEVLNDGIVDLEEVPYEVWLNNRSGGAKPVSSSKAFSAEPHIISAVRSTRTLRRISQFRVNTSEMTISQLEVALRKKMVEKMGRPVPVSLVDKLHARCGICNAIVSLNKKFEIVHLVRHFNAWHPSAHKCAGSWPTKSFDGSLEGCAGKPLAIQDFAVIDTDANASDNLQCIWCGMFMDSRALAMHFNEVHPEEIEVPKCNLCMQELILNARYTEKHSEDFRITLPDEHHIKSEKFEETVFKNEAALEKAIAKYQRQSEKISNDDEDEDTTENPEENTQKDDDDEEDSMKVASCEPYANSRMNFGRRAKPKRQFIMPAMRQAMPKNSDFIEPISLYHWKCKLCHQDIFATVISAGVIKHFRNQHPDQLDGVKFDICKARLEKISDGCMEFLNLEVIECLICRGTFPLHLPFNMSRAIRHLKVKHPEVMPEHKEPEEQPQAKRPREDSTQRMDQPGTSAGHHRKIQPGLNDVAMPARPGYEQQREELEALEEGVVYAVELTDQTQLDNLQSQCQLDFEKVYSIYGTGVSQPIYVLCNADDELDTKTVEDITAMSSSEPSDTPIIIQFTRDGK